jgi:hypothetical protein
MAKVTSHLKSVPITGDRFFMKQQTLISVTIHTYRLLMRLYPTGFREEFAGEMAAVFEERLDGAVGEGWLAMSSIIIRELFGLISEGTTIPKSGFMINRRNGHSRAGGNPLSTIVK